MSKNRHQRFVSEAVKRNGSALQYVKEQTQRFVSKLLKPEWRSFTICQRTDTRRFVPEAVKKNGYALQYVKGTDSRDLSQSCPT